MNDLQKNALKGRWCIPVRYQKLPILATFSNRYLCNFTSNFCQYWQFCNPSSPLWLFVMPWDSAPFDILPIFKLDFCYLLAKFALKSKLYMFFAGSLLCGCSRTFLRTFMLPSWMGSVTKKKNLYDKPNSRHPILSHRKDVSTPAKDYIFITLALSMLCLP